MRVCVMPARFVVLVPLCPPIQLVPTPDQSRLCSHQMYIGDSKATSRVLHVECAPNRFTRRCSLLKGAAWDSSVPSRVATVVCQCGIMPVPASVGNSLAHQTVWFLPLARSGRARVEKKKTSRQRTIILSAICYPTSVTPPLHYITPLSPPTRVRYCCSWVS